MFSFKIVKSNNITVLIIFIQSEKKHTQIIKPYKNN